MTKISFEGTPTGFNFIQIKGPTITIEKNGALFSVTVDFITIDLTANNFNKLIRSVDIAVAAYYPPDGMKTVQNILVTTKGLELNIDDICLQAFLNGLNSL